jgi:hypothetical protein
MKFGLRKLKFSLEEFDLDIPLWAYACLGLFGFIAFYGIFREGYRLSELHATPHGFDIKTAPQEASPPFAHAEPPQAKAAAPPEQAVPWISIRPSPWPCQSTQSRQSCQPAAPQVAISPTIPQQNRQLTPSTPTIPSSPTERGPKSSQNDEGIRPQSQSAANEVSRCAGGATLLDPSCGPPIGGSGIDIYLPPNVSLSLNGPTLNLYFEPNLIVNLYLQPYAPAANSYLRPNSSMSGFPGGLRLVVPF